MPKKIKKMPGGRIVEIKSILLPNGNLLIPGRSPEDRNKIIWVEVVPGSQDHKRWWPRREIEPDPRELKSE